MLAERITLEGTEVTAECEAVECINLMTATPQPAYKDVDDYPLREALRDIGCYHIKPAEVD